MEKNSIWVVTDSNSGISAYEGKKYGIGVIPMPFRIEGKEYYEDITISRKKFFECLKEGKSVQTSQPSVEYLMDVFGQGLKKYEDIIYIPMSSGLSGSVMTASSVAEEFDGRVHVIDNHRISCTQKQSVLEAVKLVEKGYDVFQICELLEERKYNASIYIAVDTLEYLKRGGRITKAGAAIGDMLNIKPILQIQGGRLDAYKKVRGRKAAQRMLIEAIQNDMEHRFSGKDVIIKGAYCGDQEYAELWQCKMRKSFPDYCISLDPLALSICCHVGPGAIAAVCMEKFSDTKDVIYEL